MNYADTHHAENSYLAKTTLLLVPGGEVVGRTGGRAPVAALVGSGGYAERAVGLGRRSLDVPAGIDDVTAPCCAGHDRVCCCAAACTWNPASRWSSMAAGGVGNGRPAREGVGGRRVIATASSAEKRQLALDLGADVAIDANAENMTDALREANGGPRVDVVLDMTGGRITDESIAALAPFGRLAFYGMANRQPPEPVAPGALLAHSTTIAGMWLVHAARVPGLLAGALTDLFGLVAAGTLRAIPGGDYPLADARQAHEDLRARRTVGKLVLDPRR